MFQRSENASADIELGPPWGLTRIGDILAASTTGGRSTIEWIFLPFFAVNQKCSGWGRISDASLSLLNAVSVVVLPEAGSRRTIWPGSVDAAKRPITTDFSARTS